MAIAKGDCESAIVGGTNLILAPDLFSRLSDQGVLSPDGESRTFSANANGLFSGLNVGTDGKRPSLSAGDIVQGGLGQGVGDAADTVSKYLIERAEQYQPVIEMPTGIDVEIVFLDGVYVRNPQ